MKKTHTSVTWVLATLAVAAPTSGQLEQPPEIMVDMANRGVGAGVDADGVHVPNDEQSAEGGPFVETVAASSEGAQGSSGSTSASQNSSISTFSMHGSGIVEASSSTSATGVVSVGTSSNVTVTFTIPVDAPFSFSGRLDSGSNDPLVASSATASLTGTAANGDPIVFQAQSFLEGEVNFSLLDPTLTELKANTMATLQVSATIFYTSTIPGSHEGFASFDFTFDLGDRDHDGLLDAWEEEGLDIDGDDIPEIDLPSMGANPDVKDIFVEVDVMSGVSFEPSVLFAVEYAFAQAPAWAVENSDGSAGIQLHTVVDGDRPGHQALVTPLNGLPLEYYDIKDSFFGSDEDRNHPKWDEIRDARLRIYRYCLWADTLVRGSDSRHLLGRAEAIPSNDFIVAAGTIFSSYPDFISDELASTFMHEFGHSLGLRHGGQTNENRKPNYLSIMNYAYGHAIRLTSSQGTRIADYWRLDYSRSSMIDLDETELYETQSLSGPAGRYIVHNHADENDADPVRRRITWANRPTSNWNGNGEDPEADPYQLDLTRNDSSVPAHYDPTLESYSDWDRLWYHLSGSSKFFDRQPWPFAGFSPGLVQAEIDAFYDVEWTDETADGDLVFENGFELGSTTAWSDTVPR